MKYVALYFLIGAVTAVWTAINQARIERSDQSQERTPLGAMLGAYLMIALAWPLSVVVFLYGLISQLLTGAEQEDG